MAVLNGDQIESLLWKEGFDFTHKTFLDEPSYLKVSVESCDILIGETWTEGGDSWFLDSDLGTIAILVDGDPIKTVYTDSLDEQGLVDLLIAID